MKSLVPPILALVLCSCASAPRVAPRFVQPSTVPIAQAHAAAKTHIQQAKQQVVKIESDCPAAKAEIEELQRTLDDTMADFLNAEGARVQLDTQLKANTQQANTLADNYDKAGAQITSLRESRHGWVKRFWIAAGLLTVALVWIFRKPILMAVGGLGSL